MSEETTAKSPEAEKARPIASLTFVLSHQTIEKKSSFIPDTGPKARKGHGKNIVLESYIYKLTAKEAPEGVKGHPILLTLSGVKSFGWVPGQEINVDLWEGKSTI